MPTENKTPLTDEQADLAARWWLFCYRTAAGRWPNLHRAVEDADAVARVAVCFAARAYRPERGWAFSTYAVTVIRWRWVREVEAAARRPRAVRFGEGDDGRGLEADVPAPDREAGLDFDETAAVRLAVAALPPAHRDVVAAVHLGGESQFAFAGRAGISRARAGQVAAEALAHLARTLARRDGGVSARPVLSRAGLDALRVRSVLERAGPLPYRRLARRAGCNFARLAETLRFGGWFERLDNGRWALTEAGKAGELPQGVA